MKDLSAVPRTITNRVESLIGRMEKMTDSDIREEFVSILESDQTYASAETIKKWKTAMTKRKGKVSIMQMITNLYLAGSNLSLD